MFPDNESKYSMKEFTYQGTLSLILGFMHLDIYSIEKWLLNFKAVSVFINLNDYNDIRTTECWYSNESNYTVTQNGCLGHGHVVYPLFFDHTDYNTLPADDKLKIEEYQILLLENMYEKVSSPKPCFHSKNFFIYLTRLLTDPDFYKNCIIHFCK